MIALLVAIALLALGWLLGLRKSFEVRSWIAVALLSMSWVVGLGYYHHFDWLDWSIMVGAAVVLLLGAPPINLPWPIKLGAGILLIITGFLTSWPIAAVPWIVAGGLLISLLPQSHRWPQALASAGVWSGLILVAGALAIFAYQSITGRSHELPWPLPDLLGFIAQFVGIDAASDGNTVALHTMRKLHELGATWDSFFDPATCGFIIGGFALLALRARQLPRGGRLRPFARGAALLLLCIIAWLPIRSAISMSLMVHRALRVEFESPLILMDQFRNTWVLLAMLIPPIVLAARFARTAVVAIPVIPMTTKLPAIAPLWRRFAAVGAALAATFAITFVSLWDPSGPRKPGRILVDEFHSKWEPTQRPFDTEWYGHDSGYNYASIYDYLGKFYEIGRIESHISDVTLAGCDVLISKVPTSRYDPDEIDAIVRFVRRGGGIALVGEHTDVFGTGVSLNDIASRFGFAFRYDVILDTDTRFEQKLVPHWAPHPATEYVGDFNFAVTCSIDPGASVGRAAVLSRSLCSLGPDYHASNFYPPVDDASDERYGAFVQAWATRAGKGRIFAWADSTIWSNFCTFEPGKIEMLMGIVEWLNHRNDEIDLRYPTWFAAIALLLATLWLARGWNEGTLAIFSAAFLGWALAGPALHAVHRHGMPPISPKPGAALHRVIIDRTVCATLLSNGGFIDGKPDGFGVFERWILRLGYVIKRTSGDDALKDDLIVFTYPSKDVPDDFRDALVRYVQNGGKVLVIDAPENATSTANSLLYPFHLEMKRGQALPAGDLTPPPGWSSTHVASAVEVAGGEPLILLDGKPVASTARIGKGTVTALGFGARLTDPSMGVTGDTIPDDDLLKTYALDYALMRWIVEGRQPPATEPSSQPTTTAAPTTEQVKDMILPYRSGNLEVGPGK
ncbi:MAG TPA: hypothetical protein VH370_18660 [Humisphaera sp.]|jgi:hypothetical protein|nr:hypothetical protein [Humisphaera sp.]